MSETTLSTALEAEHREIDAGIEEYARTAQAGSPQVGPVLRAMGALRRHIYLEEALLFPTLREAGLVAPVFVMVREHGEIWRSMDALESAVATDATGSAATDICREMVRQLEAHNTKEEMILYPQADAVVTGEAQATLQAFLAAGSMPEGWVCQGA